MNSISKVMKRTNPFATFNKHLHGKTCFRPFFQLSCQMQRSYSDKLFPDQDDIEKIQNYDEEEFIERSIDRLQDAKIKSVAHMDRMRDDISEENTLKAIENLNNALSKYSDRIPTHDEMNYLIYEDVDSAVKYVLKSVTVFNQDINDKSFTMLEHPERAGLELDPMEAYDFDMLASTNDPMLKSYDPKHHGIDESEEKNIDSLLEERLLAKSTYHHVLKDSIVPLIKRFYEHYDDLYNRKVEKPKLGFKEAIFGYIETLDKQIGLLINEVSGVHLPTHLRKHFHLTPTPDLYNGMLDIIVTVHNPQLLAQFLTSMQKKDIGLNQESYIILARQGLKNMDKQYALNLIRFMEHQGVSICDEVRDVCNFIVENADPTVDNEFIYIPKDKEKNIDFRDGLKRYGY